MKSSIISSASSSKTPATTTASSSFAPGGGRNRPEGRGDSGCYFPGCRKDTNCKCKICLASIHATLDLVPTGSSITKLSNLPKRAALRPATVETEKPPATPDLLSAATSSSITPPIQTTAKSRPKIRRIPAKKKRSCGPVHFTMMLLFGIFLVMTVDLGFLKDLIEGFGPTLTKEILEKFKVESQDQSLDLIGRLRILELKIGGIVDGGVRNCSSLNSSWDMNQVGLHFFHWRCVIYESMAEEVSVWGSPLPTSGLLSTGFSSHWLALLSGRITEWSDGKLESTSRAGNGSSWTQQRWATVAVQLEGSTWVLEYTRSALYDGPSILSSAMELLRLKSINMFKLLKREPWRLLPLGLISDSSYHHPGVDDSHFLHPT